MKKHFGHGSAPHHARQAAAKIQSGFGSPPGISMGAPPPEPGPSMAPPAAAPAAPAMGPPPPPGPGM